MFRTWTLAFLTLVSANLSADEAMNGFLAESEVQEQMKRSENICISMMLLGCMGFMMSNFYLVNWPDADIRRISWEVISSTVSIFSAVLLFQAVNKVLEYYLLEGMWIWFQLVVDMVHMLLWFIALQLVLAYLSGAVGSHSEVRNTKSSLTESLRVTSREKLKRIQSADMHMEAVKTNTVCWATLLGHVTGFAAINAWGTLQQAVPQNLFSCTLVPALTLAGIFCIYQTTEKLRKMQTELDGEEDHFEELWGEQVAETEDDVMSLAVSFLLVQALRFAISGHLPNVEGNDPEGLRQPNVCSELLLFSGFLFGGFDLMRISLRKAWAKFRQEGDEEAVSDHSFNELDEEHRFSTWTRDIMAMGTAWCLHFSVDWWLSANIYADGAVLAVICAVVVTCFALGLIFVLDKLADMDFTDDEVDSSLRALIQSLGILIGFSWERSFDEAVGGLAEGQVFGLPPPVLTLMLAIVLASMVIPAWKWYILPVVLAHQAESRKHHEHHSEHGSPVHVLGLKKPLLEDSGHSAPEITDVDADLRKKLEAAYKSIKDLEATLAERDAAVAEAKLRHSDLESALASAQRGAEEHSNLRLQKEKELQQKEQQIGGYERRLKAAEDAAKASQADLDQMRSIQKTAQTQADTAELYGKQLLSLQEALAQAKAMAADQEALGNQWKQVAQDEAGKRAALEVALTKRSSALAELEAEKNAELGRMAAVATDSECRLRQAQAALAEHEQAASKTAANDLKEQLAKALEQVNQASNQLAAAEKESLVLRAEVSRLRENKTPSFVPMFAGRAARTTHPIGPSSPQEVPVATPPVPGLSQPIRPAAFASPSLNTMPPSLKAMPQLKAAPKAATSVRRVPPKPKASSANSPQKRSPAKTQL